jgi:hypothetical protein
MSVFRLRVGIPERTKTLWKYLRRWECNIKTNLKAIA